MRYEKLNVNGGGFHEGDGAEHEQNYRKRMRQRRNMIRQLICMNFDSNSKFVTLTFNDQMSHDIKNVQECNAYFKIFARKLRTKYPGFKYVAVIEFQDKNGRGAIHYHMICNLPYIKKSELAEIWAGGFVKINKIDKVDNIGAYVIKYMTTDSDDERLKAENGYLRSQGLDNPIELKSWSGDSESISGLYESLKGKSPSYSAKYESDKAGSIEYYQFNLSR